MKQYRTLLLSLAFILILLATFLVLRYNPGVGVRVRNSGDTVLRSVVVEVTGGRYEIGDVIPGTTGTIRVYPTGESSIYIEVTTEAGRRRKLIADVYLEPDYGGEVEASIDDGRLTGLVVKMSNK